MSETWKPVVGYEGLYSVSNLGRIYSEGREVLRGPGGRGRAFQPGRVLEATRSSGRATVTLCRDGSREQCRVAPLVLGAFVGPRPRPHMDCCHEDGDPANDTLSNLRWDTKKANQADKMRHGRHHYAGKPTCKRGHKLSGDNLIRTKNGRTKNGRTCKACSHTNYWGRTRGIATGSPMWLAEADRRYALIMSGQYEKEPQTECLRRHSLKAPNLVAGIPGRACLTCSNTRAWAYYYGITDDDPRWEAESDRRYAEIMAGKPPSRGARRTTCTLDHLLRKPNLRSGPGKKCRACGNTQAWAHARKIPKSDPRWTAEADRRYAEIMSTTEIEQR